MSARPHAGYSLGLLVPGTVTSGTSTTGSAPVVLLIDAATGSGPGCALHLPVRRARHVRTV